MRFSEFHKLHLELGDKRPFPSRMVVCRPRLPSRWERTDLESCGAKHRRLICEWAAWQRVLIYIFQIYFQKICSFSCLVADRCIAACFVSHSLPNQSGASEHSGTRGSATWVTTRMKQLEDWLRGTVPPVGSVKALRSGSHTTLEDESQCVLYYTYRAEAWVGCLNERQ